MAGHIQQRADGSSRRNAFIGRDANNRKRYASNTVHGTKREAELALAAFVTEVARDRSAKAIAEPITVSQILDQWLKAKSPTLAPSTIDRYKVAIKHVEPVIGTMKVSRLRGHHVEDLYGDLLTSGQSGSSIRKVHWAMRQSLAWAQRRSYVAIIATDGVELPPLGERKTLRRTPPTCAERSCDGSAGEAHAVGETYAGSMRVRAGASLRCRELARKGHKDWRGSTYWRRPPHRRATEAASGAG